MQAHLPGEHGVMDHPAANEAPLHISEQTKERVEHVKKYIEGRDR